MATVKYIVQILFLTLLFQSCSKNDGANSSGNDPDRENPIITIISPTNNQSFAAGNTIQISAKATDNDIVSELHIHVTNKISGVSIKDVHAYPRSPSGTVQDFIIGQSGVTYIIKLMALDAAVNLTVAEVEVSCN